MLRSSNDRARRDLLSSTKSAITGLAHSAGQSGSSGHFSTIIDGLAMSRTPLFAAVMFCELGGEFVDTDQKDIIDLSKEFGIEMQRLDVAGGEDLYFFGGKLTPKDMIDSEKQTGAFAPIAEKIAEDAEKLRRRGELDGLCPRAR